MTFEDYYDRYFSDDEIRGASSFLQPVTQRVTRRFHNKLQTLGENREVIELGCGDDPLALVIETGATGVTAVDVSEVVIRKNRTRHSDRSNMTFRVDDCQDLDCPDNRYDLVFGRGILPCVNLSKALDEIDRVLSDGGSFLFMEPLGSNPVIETYRALTAHKRASQLRYVSQPELRMIARRFPGVTFEYFNLFTLLSAPFGGTSSFDRIYHALHETDQWCFRQFPTTRSLAWWVIISWTRDGR